HPRRGHVRVHGDDRAPRRSGHGAEGDPQQDDVPGPVDPGRVLPRQQPGALLGVGSGRGRGHGRRCRVHHRRVRGAGSDRGRTGSLLVRDLGHAVRALVTGSMGFIGRHFWNELPRRGWEVDVCDIKAGPGVMELFGRSTNRYDLVVHAASRSPHRVAIDTQPASHIYNQLLDAAMFDWVVRTKQGRVLYLSSCAAADAEPDAYGLLKLTGERMAVQARAAGVPVTVVRPYSGYGEDQSEDFPFRAFVERARRREDPFDVWGDGKQVRDWI